MTLSLGTAYRSFGGEVEASSTPTICRLPDSRRHQLWAIALDWSHEVVLLSGVTVIVKAAHVRLCHSRMLFVRAYPRETQEMVFDAHDRAFALFKGTCRRGIYDNMKTAVETIFVGKGRLYNRRFLQMCSHYLVDPRRLHAG